MAHSTDHKEGVAAVGWVYFMHNTLKDGSHPFYVRIIKDRKTKYVATGLSLHPQFWNKAKNECRRSVPAEKRREIERGLEQWVNRFREAAEQLATNDQPHTANDIVSKAGEERNANRRFTLLGYFTELIDQFTQTGSVGNRKVYRDVQNNLTRFVGEGKDVSFDQVSVKFCNDWERKMRAEGLSEVALSIKFRTLRSVINKAIANGYAKADSYPFARNAAEKHKFQVGKFDTRTTKRAISRTDIAKIEDYQPPADTEKYASLRQTQSRLQLARDLFLFSYYCGGINFIDMAALRWSNVNTDLNGKLRLTYTRQKTGGRFSLRLLSKTLTILDRYKSDQLAHNSHIFPILNTALHRTPSQQHNRCSKIMGQVNADLKTIGAACNIKTPLTTYVARHSFATALKRSGVATAIISEAMGHTDERTTQIYLSEFDSDLIDAAFDNL